MTVIGSNPIQSIKFPENPDSIQSNPTQLSPIQSNPIQSMDGSNPCPTLYQLTDEVLPCGFFGDTEHIGVFSLPKRAELQ